MTSTFHVTNYIGTGTDQYLFAGGIDIGTDNTLFGSTGIGTAITLFFGSIGIGIVNTLLKLLEVSVLTNTLSLGCIGIANTFLEVGVLVLNIDIDQYIISMCYWYWY